MGGTLTMAHFTKLDENNLVLEVILVGNEILLDSNGIESEELGINFLIQWSGGYSNWKQTSYNTYGGVHVLGGTPLRKNYAGIGFTYDSVRDAFIPPKPFASWLLNENTCQWESPIPSPNDGKYYVWDETTTSWVEVT